MSDRSAYRNVGVHLSKLAMVLGLAMAPLSAFAQTGTASGSGTPAVSSCDAYVGLSNKVAGCILASLDHATSYFFSSFYPYVSEAIAAVMLLGIILYGVMIAFSMVENIGRDTVMLVVKIALVTYCTTNVDTLYYTATDMMNAGAQAVIQAVPTSGDADGTKTFTNITCLKNMTNASITNGVPPTGPWLAIDCMLDTVIGIKVPSADGSTDTSFTNQNLNPNRNGLSRGLLYIFTSGLKTSIVGVILGVIGLLFLYSLIRLTIKVLLVFISGYLAVAFLMIISPLFIPLVLLPGEAPKQYFDKWVKLLIGFGMQPVMMVAFITLFISAMDLAMFSSDYSVAYRIAGDASRQSGFDLNQYIADHSAIVKKPINLYDEKNGKINPPVQQVIDNSVIPESAESKCGQAAFLTGGTDDPACKNQKPVQFYRDALDWEALATARSPAVQMEDGATTVGQQLSREVIAASIYCAVLLFVLNKFAAAVPHLVSNLVGSNDMSMRNIALGQTSEAQVSPALRLMQGGRPAKASGG